jgi:hypothetical protein
LRHLSRAGVARKRDLDGDPRRRRRGRRRRRCSGDRRRQRSCAREPVSHGDRVGTINWKDKRWIKGNRRRPKRQRRGRTPASVGEVRWWTREPMNGSGSFGVMMWCWLRCLVGVERLGSSCPRCGRGRRRRRSSGMKLLGKLGRNRGSSSMSKQQGSLCKG